MRNNMGRYLRHPKTQNERRQADALVADGLKPRPKRNVKRLPSYYDDKPIAALYEQDYKKK